jgi:hypothetical protein
LRHCLYPAWFSCLGVAACAGGHTGYVQIPILSKLNEEGGEARKTNIPVKDAAANMRMRKTYKKFVGNAAR